MGAAPLASRTHVALRRYPEAQAAAKRLAELKSAQAAAMRRDHLGRQRAEIEALEAAYRTQISQLNAGWDKAIADYEAAFRVQVRPLAGVALCCIMTLS
jgi:hypothetical protein